MALGLSLGGAINVGQILQWGIWLSALLIILFIGFIFLLRASYNISVVVYEQVGSGVRIINKKAKKVENLAGSNLKFLFAKKWLMPLPAAEFFYPKGNKNYMISLYRDKNGQLKPIQLRFTEDKNPLFVAEDSDTRFWYSLMLQQGNDVYKASDFWSKWGNLVILGGTIAAAVTILLIYGYYFFNGFNTVGAQMNSQMAELTKTLHTLTGVAPNPQPQAVSTVVGTPTLPTLAPIPH